MRCCALIFDTTAPHPPAEPGAQIDASIRELTFDGVQGWHEIIVVEGEGATLDESSVPSEDLTDELTVYPPDMLTNPLHVREATFRYTLIEGSVQPSPTVGPSSTPTPTASPSAPPVVGGPSGPTDPLVALVGPELTLGAMVVGVVVAIVLGAAHAISPGHGKTLVAAYIIGTRANIGQALWLGLTVAITHTAGVLALGVATYAATEWLVPARVVGWLSVTTGVLILVMGSLPRASVRGASATWARRPMDMSTCTPTTTGFPTTTTSRAITITSRRRAFVDGM